MAAFGIGGTARFTPCPRIAPERGSGWLRQPRTQPLPSHTVIAVKLFMFVAIASPMIALVGSGVLGHSMRLVALQWVATAKMRWILTQT
jgi:hypothetical protein